MKEQTVFNAINDVDDDILAHVIQEKELYEKRRSYRWYRKVRRLRRVAALLLICILVSGAGVAVAAVVSDEFREQLVILFGGDNVAIYTNNSNVHRFVHLDDNNGNTYSYTASGSGADAIVYDEEIELNSKEHYYLLGQRECFLQAYHYKGKGDDKKIVEDDIYTIEGVQLVKQEKKRVKGEFYGKTFSFDYVIIGDEVLADIGEGKLDEVFSYTDGKVVYGSFSDVGGDDIVKRACVARIDLSSGEVTPITGDDMICNYMDTPSGKKLLCNHRADGFWSLLDLMSGDEKRIDNIDGYARSKEIRFVDEDHVLTLFMEHKEDSEQAHTQLVNINTDQVEKRYEEYGDIGLEWNYEKKDGNNLVDNLILTSVIDGRTITIGGIPKDIYPSAIERAFDLTGEYAVFGDLENGSKDFYLIKFSTGEYKKITVSEEFISSCEEIEYQILPKYNKMMIYSGKKMYIVDISLFDS